MSANTEKSTVVVPIFPQFIVRQIVSPWKVHILFASLELIDGYINCLLPSSLGNKENKLFSFF